MPEPQPTETQDEFIQRCIPIVIADGTAQGGGQAWAVCDSMYTEARKETSMTMEHKNINAAITEVDEIKGIVTAIFAVTGNVDQGNDRIKSGAFVKTITERGHKVRVLDNHDMTSTTAAIARPVSLREVSRAELPPETLTAYPDATGGVEIKAQFLLDDERSAAVFKRLKNKLIDEWSFGYDALDITHTQEQKAGRDIVVRNIGTVKLYEASPVLFGMNSATSTVSAKGADEPEAEQKAGRAISARNEARMRAIIDSVQKQLEQLESILPGAAVENEPEPESEEKTRLEQGLFLLKTLEGWGNVGALRQVVIDEYGLTVTVDENNPVYIGGETKETIQPETTQAGPGDSPPTIEVIELVDIDTLLKQ